MSSPDPFAAPAPQIAPQIPPPPAPDFFVPVAPGLTASDPGPRVRLSALGLASLIISASELLIVLVVRMVAALAANADDGAPTLSLTLGVLGLVSIVPTALAIVLGHLAIVEVSRGRRRGMIIAVLGTGVGYVNLLFWGNRIILALIGATQAGDFSQFVPNIFWWA